MPLAIRNWQKFQHYRDRGVVWVKLYVELLDDVHFLTLPDAAKGQLCALFLLAAKRGNVLPDRPGTLRALIGCTGRLYLPELLAGDWLVPCADGASVSASKHTSKHASNGASRPASLSRTSAPSREGEGEGEGETTPATTARVREAFLAAMPERQRPGWIATLDGWAEGLGTPGMTPFPVTAVEAGLAEYLATDGTHDFKPRHVVRFVEQCAARLAAPRHPSPTHVGDALKFSSVAD